MLFEGVLRLVAFSRSTTRSSRKDEVLRLLTVNLLMPPKQLYSTRSSFRFAAMEKRGHIQLLTFHARFPSLIFTALAITGKYRVYTANDAGFTNFTSEYMVGIRPTIVCSVLLFPNKPNRSLYSRYFNENSNFRAFRSFF